MKGYAGPRAQLWIEWSTRNKKAGSDDLEMAALARRPSIWRSASPPWETSPILDLTDFAPKFSYLADPALCRGFSKEAHAEERRLAALAKAAAAEARAAAWFAKRAQRCASVRDRRLAVAFGVRAGMNYSQIAETLGIPCVTAQSDWSLIVSHVRRVLYNAGGSWHHKLRKGYQKAKRDLREDAA